jgi:DNA-binding PadR family transcriptional regulator
LPRPVGTIGETKLKILAIIYNNELHGTITYGYDIWKVLMEVFHSYFDQCHLRNVYHHLKDLERLGLIRRSPVQTVKDAPKRQPYHLTDKGVEMKDNFSRYLEIMSK